MAGLPDSFKFGLLRNCGTASKALFLLSAPFNSAGDTQLWALYFQPSNGCFPDDKECGAYVTVLTATAVISGDMSTQVSCPYLQCRFSFTDLQEFLHYVFKSSARYIY